MVYKCQHHKNDYMIVGIGIFIIYITNNKILNYDTCSTNQKITLSLNDNVIAQFCQFFYIQNH